MIPSIRVILERFRAPRDPRPTDPAPAWAAERIRQISDALEDGAAMLGPGDPQLTALREEARQIMSALTRRQGEPVRMHEKRWGMMTAMGPMASCFVWGKFDGKARSRAPIFWDADRRAYNCERRGQDLPGWKFIGEDIGPRGERLAQISIP